MEEELERDMTPRLLKDLGMRYSTEKIGYFKTPEEAVKARDTYIIENNLPHKLNNNYKKETINGK